MPASSSTIPINGYALRWGRKLMDITPAALATAIDKDRTYIVKIETGAVSRVSVEVFDSLVAALALEDRRTLMAWPHQATEEVAS